MSSDDIKTSRRGRRRTGTLYRRNGTYYLKVTVNGKSLRRSLGVSRKSEAEQKRADVLAELGIQLRDKGELYANVADKLENVADKLARAEAERQADRERQHTERNRLRLVDSWQAFVEAQTRPDTGPATLKQYAYQWGAFVDWMKATHSDDTALADVTAEIAAEYAGHLQHERELSANTFNKHRALCQLVFRVLGKAEGISDNHFADLSRKTGRQNGRKELSFDVLAKVCDAADGEMKLLLFLGIYTGMRLKDCCLLTWEETDLVRGMIIHTPFKTARHSDEPLHIPIHPSLRNMLETVPDDARQGPVLPQTAVTYSRRRNTITSRLQRLFTDCGVQVYKEGTGGDTGKKAVLQYGFHSLRHTAVSLLLDAGAPVSVVQAIVGHHSKAMTAKYTHADERSMIAAVGNMPTLADKAKKALPAAEEPERAKLRKYAEELPIDQVRAIIVQVEADK